MNLKTHRAFVLSLILFGIGGVLWSCRPEQRTKPKIIVFGDSHAGALQDDRAGATTWNELLETNNACGLSFAGFTTGDILSHGAVDSLLKAKPDLVFLILGANNAWKQVSLSMTMIEYDAICDQLRTNDIHVVLLTIPPIEEGFVNGTRETHRVIQRYRIINSYIIDYATFYGYEYINLSALLRDEDNPPFARTGLTYDGLHYNITGYEKWKVPMLLAIERFNDTKRSP